MTEKDRDKRLAWRAYACAALSGSLASQQNEPSQRCSSGDLYKWHLRRACAFADDMLEAEGRSFDESSNG